MSPAGSSKNSPKLQPKDSRRPPDLRTSLLSTRDTSDLGTFTVPSSPVNESANESVLGESVRSGSSKKGWLHRAATTTALAEDAGVRRPWLMYISYYIPFIAWVGEYQWSFLLGDVVAGGKLLRFPSTVRHG